MNTKAAGTKPGILAAVLVTLGTGLLAGQLPADGRDGWPFGSVIRQAGHALRAEYGSLGALGGLVGSGMRIPVATAGCGAASDDRADCP